MLQPLASLFMLISFSFLLPKAEQLSTASGRIVDQLPMAIMADLSWVVSTFPSDCKTPSVVKMHSAAN
jgi:hypothetical protein